jgi:ParB-like chromosome segregation protein Spo0J
VENVHRADMHPLDKARVLKALYDRHQSYERVARESAWSVSTIRRYIQLLAFPEELQQRGHRQRTGGRRHARASRRDVLRR